MLVSGVVTYQCLLHSCLFRGRCLATDLYATIFYEIFSCQVVLCLIELVRYTHWLIDEPLEVGSTSCSFGKLRFTYLLTELDPS
jgi:hypothetical protein